MNVGDIVELAHDVVNGKRVTEGKAGEKVVIVSVSLPVLIVQNQNGKRYPINKTHLELQFS